MALKFREELVGKRFLAAKDLPKGRGVAEWEWRAGVVRAVLHGGVVNKDLQNFTAVVGHAELASSSVQPIEFFVDHLLDFQEENDYCCQPVRQAGTTGTAGRRQAELDEAVRQWLEYQDGQGILLTTPTVLVGYRVKVYRTEGTTQWYTAVIQHYNHSTRKLTILDDTVLEEHNEDPAVTQIVLLDGVVESILKGIDQRIIPRRRACNARDKELLAAGGGGGSSSGGGCATGTPLLVAVGSSSSVLPVTGAPSRNKVVQAASAVEYSRHVAAVNSAAAEHAAKQDRAPAAPASEPRSSRKLKSAAVSATAPADHPRRAGAAIASIDSASTKAARASSDRAFGKLESDSERARPSADLDHCGLGGESACPLASDSVLRELPPPHLGGARRSRKRPTVPSSSASPARTPRPGAPSSRAASGATPDRDRLSTAAVATDSAEATVGSKNQVEGSRHWDQSAADNAAAAHASLHASVDELVPEAGESQLARDMHYKKLHLLGSDTKLAGTVLASAGVAATLESADDKPTGSSSPATGSESAGAGVDKLSDCGSADAGSTSGYSTATVDAPSPLRREPIVGAAARAEGISTTASSSASVDADTVWSIESKDAAAAMAVGACNDELKAGRAGTAAAFGCSTEPVQVYRDPELLKKDEETCAGRRFALAGQQPAQLREAAVRGAGMPRPAPTASASAGHQSSTAATACSIAAGAADGQHGGSATTVAPVAGVPAAASSQQPQAAAATTIVSVSRTNAQHLLASAQQLAHLEQLQQIQQLQQLFQRQQELAAIAQLQFLWQQKYSVGRGGGSGSSGHSAAAAAAAAASVPWNLLAYHEDLVRRSYREAAAAAACGSDERLDRGWLERSDKGRQASGSGAGCSALGGGCNMGANAVDRHQQRQQYLGQLAGDDATARPKEHAADLPPPPASAAVKMEPGPAVSASTATACAVDQHFSESLRLATKKVSSGTSVPLWQHTGSYHKLLSSAGYGGLQNRLSEKRPSGHGRLTQPQDGDSVGCDLHGTESTKGFTPTIDPLLTGSSRGVIVKVEPLAEAAKEASKDRHTLAPLLPIPPRQRSASAARHPADSRHGFCGSSGAPLPPHPADPSRLSPVMGGGGSIVDSAAGSRLEPNFSLYGFQPYQTTYISQDKLHRRLDMPSSARTGLGSASAQRPLQETGLVGSHVGSTGHDVAADVKVEAQLSPCSSSDVGGLPGSPQKRQEAASAGIVSCITSLPAAGPQPSSSDRRGQPLLAIDGQRKLGSRRKQLSPAFHAPPVSLASAASASCSLSKRFERSDSVAYPYQNLIQEGLVPNPIYSQALPLPIRSAASGGTGRGDVQQQLLLHSLSTTQQSDERMASEKSCGGADCSAAPPKRSPLGLPEPVFVAPCPTLGGGESVIRHSFKSILESAMQKAYMQDLEEDRKKQEQQDRSDAAARDTACFNPSFDAEAVGASPPLLGVPPTLSPNSDTRGSIGSGTGTTTGSRCSRGSTALAETDSDTLSAPSPPTCLKRAYDNSNDDSSRAEAPALPAHSHHPKLKKAWLQRHSGEDGAGAEASAAASAARASSTLHRQPAAADSPLPPAAQLPLTGGLKALPSDAAASVATPGLSLHGYEPLASAVLANGEAELCYHGDTTSSASEAESRPPEAVLKRNASGSRRAKAKKTLATSGSTSCSSTRSQLAAGSKRARPASRRSSLHKQSSTASSSRLLESDAAAADSDDDSDSALFPALKRKRIETPASAAGGTLPTDSSGSEGSVGKPARLNIPARIPKSLVKASTAQLKRSGQPFLQDGYCCEVTPKLQKCRECKMTPHQRSKKMANIFCRFYAFRRLRFSQRGILTTAGFSEPTDAESEDLQLWLPASTCAGGGGSNLKASRSELPSLDVSTAKYIIANVGDEFCKLVEQEKECRGWANPNDKIMWKRAVQGVRETCDVCDTTLFNMHWVCQKCGFVVCMDCYRAKRNLCSNFGPAVPVVPVDEKGDADCSRKWLTCSSGRQPHEATKLTLTQIIPGDALLKISDMIHDVRIRHGIKANCPCGRSNEHASEDSETECIGSPTSVTSTPKNGVCQQLLKAVSRCYPSATQKASKFINGDMAVKGAIDRCGSQQCCYDDAAKAFGSYSDDPLSLLADVASMDSSSRDKVTVNSTMNNSKKDDMANGVAEVDDALASRANGARKGCQTLRKLLLSQSFDDDTHDGGPNDDGTNGKSPMARSPVSYSYYQPRNGSFMRGRRKPVPICQLRETSLLYPDVPHSWLCEGRLLRLHDPRHGRNFTLFNQRWKLGQPVMVSNVTNQMQVEDLWSPATFAQEFGHMEGDLVNCRSGVLIIGQQIKDFWCGFENPNSRITDSDKQPMLLKLKDWPPGEDFSDVLPTRFRDLTNALPMPEYTRRDGHLNLVSRLPDFFVKPDLGPKMYSAYGMAKYPHLGTTNLHLDISDAVNVMVYVARDATIEADVLRCIAESDVDDVTRQRFALEKEAPGALWHIWDACDADKIRDLLNKVAAERGEHVEPYHDPIHDQSCYLDNELRDRLRREYGVHGFAIVQCAGDAVFIPAGAPHQVQNLNSCIKVAEDFVSPEHLHHCFKLTQEFRHLSSTHSNHEDKLQVKNIIYHAVKDAVAVLNTVLKTADSTGDHRNFNKKISLS